MATSSSGSPTKFQTLMVAMLSGFSSALPSAIKNLSVAGVVMTPAQIVTELQSMLLTLTTVLSTKAAYQAAVADRKAAMPADRTFYDNLVMALKMAIGNNQAQLAPFGINLPKTRAKLTTDQASIAKAKATATRALRGTKSKKQKQALTLAGQSSIQVLGPNGQPLTASTSSTPSASSSAAPGSSAAPVAVAPVVPTTTGH